MGDFEVNKPLSNKFDWAATDVLTPQQEKQETVAITLIFISVMVGLIAIGATIGGSCGVAGHLWAQAPDFMKLVGGALTFWGAMGMAGGSAFAFLLALGGMVLGAASRPKLDSVPATSFKFKDIELFVATMDDKAAKELAESLGEKECLVTEELHTKKLRLSYLDRASNVASVLYDSIVIIRTAMIVKELVPIDPRSVKIEFKDKEPKFTIKRSDS